uniref:Uncharacterized protein n=1 Tax=Sphaerodactylus townsendi TaxID=933632 RepID=A0ACB8ELB0_9SAUR
MAKINERKGIGQAVEAARGRSFIPLRWHPHPLFILREVMPGHSVGDPTPVNPQVSALKIMQLKPPPPKRTSILSCPSFSSTISTEATFQTQDIRFSPYLDFSIRSPSRLKTAIDIQEYYPVSVKPQVSAVLPEESSHPSPETITGLVKGTLPVLPDSKKSRIQCCRHFTVFSSLESKVAIILNLVEDYLKILESEVHQWSPEHSRLAHLEHGAAETGVSIQNFYAF